MDRLQLCTEELRRLAKETEDPDCVVLAEQAINDYLQNEIDALRSALERIGKALDDEASPTFSTRGLRQRFWWGEGVRKRVASKGRVGNSPVV